MSEQILIKYSEEIKKELIEHYATLSSNVDVKAQILLQSQSSKKQKCANKNKEEEYEEKVGEKSPEEIKDNILKENVFLIEQIERVLDSNLKDVNNYFDNLKQNDEIHQIISSRDDDLMNKEEIKRRALKSYIICVKKKKYSNFGLHCEFQWYLDNKQISFIE